MRVILLGNAGAGKSTLARKLIQREPAARLSLDQIAFDRGIQRRPVEESVAEARRFIAENPAWIIEGCYADILEPILGECEQLFFLNPGIDACIAHCRSRPWEPEKFPSRKEQDDNLENLIAWLSTYETRTDEYGLRRHRALYEAFEGTKREFTHPSDYASATLLL